MPAVPYPQSPMPAQPVAPRTGPNLPTAVQGTAAERDPVMGASTRPGDPDVVSGPGSPAAPDLLMGSLGWGLHTARFTPTSAAHKHGGRGLADAGQLHYNDPGTIPGPGGDYLIEPIVPKSLHAPADSAPVTLGTITAGLKPTQQAGLVPPEA